MVSQAELKSSKINKVTWPLSMWTMDQIIVIKVQLNGMDGRQTHFEEGGG